MFDSIIEYIEAGHDTSMPSNPYRALVNITLDLSVEADSYDDAESCLFYRISNLDFTEDDIVDIREIEWVS